MSREDFRNWVLDEGDDNSGLVYIGDALHRIGKALEMLLPTDEVERRRHRNTKQKVTPIRRRDKRVT